ncbi:MAG: class I SAM-dependent rRNA methyltransferase [Planctomycetes bacterium]|nr:class I SAM-dependent rRNA methyltransferase [Planctomycetota bacterium]
MSGVVRATGKGRRWLAGGHPWLFRDDVAEVDAEPGALVAVVDPAGATLGHGLFSAASKIAVRLVARGTQRPGEEFWDERVRRAVEHRARHGFLAARGACRLLAGDADGVPGLVVDRYADVLVVQSGTLAADRLRDGILARLAAHLPFPVRAVHERSDSGARKLEGLEPRSGPLSGALAGEVLVEEQGLCFAVDVAGGHKTGHYLDQRANRALAAERARGASVLDAFCYDGLFGIQAALGGAARVTCVDQSASALERARANAERNGVLERLAFERADCMQDLRARAERGERHGLVVVDPPAFARNRREVSGAERGYVELNRRAFALVDDGGALVSASCSYNVRAADFTAWLARAAHLAGVDAWLEDLRGAPLDHPVLLGLPESSYLKCAFVRVANRAW